MIRQLPGEIRHPGAAQTVPTGRQHHMARQHEAGLPRRHDVQFDQAVRSRRDTAYPVFVAHIQRQHLAIPAQVLGPLQARDFIQCCPAVGTELRFVPGAKRQGRQTERRAGQLFRRAQCFHPRCGRPRAFETGWRLIENHRRHAQMPQLCRQGKPRHAAANDCYIQHSLPGVRPRLDPRLGGQIQPHQILLQASFERRETGRCVYIEH